MVLLAYAAASKKFSYFLIQLKSILHFNSMVEISSGVDDCKGDTAKEKDTYCLAVCLTLGVNKAHCVVDSNLCSCT